MKRVCLLTAYACGSALSATVFFGCGEGQRTQTGTQVEVTDTLQREAEASSKFLEQQEKTRGRSQ